MSNLTGQPIIILRESEQTKGRQAQRNNIMAARAVANAVQSTLGPRGRDKLLVDTLGDVLITNDGATILDELDIQHPAAKMLVQVSKTVDEQTGDGTTSSVILAGELLRRAEDLLDKAVHPTLIVQAYKEASDKAIEFLKELAVKTDKDEDLVNIAKTALNSKAVSGEREYLARFAVDAVKAVFEDGQADLDRISILQKHGKSLKDSELIKGVVIDKEVVHSRMPKSISNAKIALLNIALENKKTEFDAKIRINDASQVSAFLDEEEKLIQEMVDKIISSGATVVFSQKGIDDLAQHFLAKAGILAARRVKKSDMERIAKSTGANVVTNLDDLSASDLGSAGKVNEDKLGDEKVIYVKDAPNPKSVAIIIRGANKYFTDEAERAVHDSLCVVRDTLEDGTVVGGGGYVEIILSKKLKDFATTYSGREQLAVLAFAESLEIIPKTLAENAGLSSMDI
ncbi:MAG: thermosome subunit beta, partial [Candidatus Heimdallarchaeota archaeon]